MSGQPLRIGMIGAGRIAGAHVDACQALAGRAQVVAVASRTEDKARSLAERAGADRVFTDHRTMLEQADLDAVIICLPYQLHHAVGMAAAEAGKHILIEKPMAMTADEAAELVRAAEAHGVRLMVGQSRRFSDAAMQAHRLREEIGPILRMVTNFMVHFPSPPTGWWNDPAQAGALILPLQGVHYIDFALWFMNALPDRVFATTHRHNPAFRTPDEGDVMLRFADGRTAAIHLSLNARSPVHETVLVGERGVLRLEEDPLDRPFQVGLRLTRDGSTVMEGPQVPSVYTRQLDQFAEALARGREPPASGREVLAVMEVLDAAIRSAHTGEIASVARRTAA